MFFEELHIDVTDCSDMEFLDSSRASTPAWLIRLACSAHAAAASLAECRDLCEWFGVERRRATIQHWYQAYADYYEQEFTAEPDRVAVDEKQIQLEHEQNAWLYAAIDVDSKVVLHAQLSWHRGRDPAEQFSRELKEKHRVSDAEFLVDGMGYLTALARTDLGGELNYTDRNIVEKLFQTLSMRIDRFHAFWRGSPKSARRWLQRFRHHYNHDRPNQALDGRTPVEEVLN